MMNVMRKVFAVVGVTALCVATVATPAQAVYGCSTGALCLYDTGIGSEYPMVDHDWPDANIGQCITLGINLRNRTSYVANLSSKQWTVYTGSNCAGTAGPIYPNTWGLMSGVYNNSIDSFKRVS